MQRARHRKWRKKLDQSEIRVDLPRDFEFKILGKLVEDLTHHLETKTCTRSTTKTLERDFQSVLGLIRKRDKVGVSTIGASLSTQSTLKVSTDIAEGDAEAFFMQYQLGAFLKKYPFTGLDTKQPAIKKFLKAEKCCALFNSENYRALVEIDKTFDPVFGGMVESIKTDIEKLLGCVPDVKSVEACALHGPGKAIGDFYDGGLTTEYYKWSTLPYTVTCDAEPYARETINADPRWIGALDDWYRNRCENRYGPIDQDDFWSRVFKVVGGSRITTVPKTAVTDRTIAIEPCMNVFLQLGVDRTLRKKLLKWGVDINTQEVNKTYARIGAKNGTYATIDLAAASDTISMKICEMLLPPAWYLLLCDLRSPKGEFLGITRSFDKISSMGNGFTFALETLIFAAVARHVMRRLGSYDRTIVFGDDIIVPTPCAPALIRCLSLCGFQTNDEKTFISGPFRESCGSDFYQGYNVRPVFLKRRIVDVMDLFYVHNALWNLESSLSWTWDLHFHKTRRFLRKYIPAKYRNVYGPSSESLDSHLFSNRRIPGIGQSRWHFVFEMSARKFNNQSSYFFRKLMAPLKGGSAPDREKGKFGCHFFRSLNRSIKGDEHPRDAYDKRKQLTTGNSFDITRRDSVQLSCTKMPVFW